MAHFDVYFDPLIRISAGFLGILRLDFIDEDQDNSLLTPGEINDAVPNFTQLNEETKPHAFDNDNQERYGAARSSWRRQTITVNPPAAAPTGTNRWCPRQRAEADTRAGPIRPSRRPSGQTLHPHTRIHKHVYVHSDEASSSSRTEALTTVRLIVMAVCPPRFSQPACFRLHQAGFCVFGPGIAPAPTYTTNPPPVLLRSSQVQNLRPALLPLRRPLEVHAVDKPETA